MAQQDSGCHQGCGHHSCRPTERAPLSPTALSTSGRVVSHQHGCRAKWGAGDFLTSCATQALVRGAKGLAVVGTWTTWGLC